MMQRNRTDVETATLRRLPVRLAVLALAGIVVVLPAFRGATGSGASGAGALTGRTTPMAPVTGIINTNGGVFMNQGDEIRLRGMNVAHQIPTDAELDQLADWGFNFLRYQLKWGQLELLPPVKIGPIWVHTWDIFYMADLKEFVRDAADRGIWVLIDNHGCGGCGYFNFPDYLYDALFNSKGINYPETEEGLLQAATDFWTDHNRQEFTKHMWEYVAGELKNVTGVAGYEVLNEPKQGNLLDTHATTALMLGVQHEIAEVIRDADPARTIFFTTRAGFAPGAPVADYTDWQALGNVAFDVHDYFGARWGDGLGGEVPSEETYQELLQLLYNHLLSDEGVSPYIGTTQVQVEFMKQLQNVLTPIGIPLLVGEGGTYVTDLGAATFFGTMTNAANYVGASWSVSAFKGALGILNSDGSPKPYAQIVIDAANEPY